VERVQCGLLFVGDQLVCCGTVERTTVIVRAELAAGLLT